MSKPLQVYSTVPEDLKNIPHKMFIEENNWEKIMILQNSMVPEEAAKWFGNF